MRQKRSYSVSPASWSSDQRLSDVWVFKIVKVSSRRGEQSCGETTYREYAREDFAEGYVHGTIIGQRSESVTRLWDGIVNRTYPVSVATSINVWGLYVVEV